MDPPYDGRHLKNVLGGSKEHEQEFGKVISLYLATLCDL